MISKNANAVIFIIVLALPTGQLFAADQPVSSADKLKRIYEITGNVGQHRDLQALLPYFKDTDPSIRTQVFDACTYGHITSAEMVLALMDAAASDPDPNAKANAKGACDGLRDIQGSRFYPGVMPSAVDGLVQLCASDQIKDRIRALRALEKICAPIPDCYQKEMQDSDVGVRIAAINAATMLFKDPSLGQQNEMRPVGKTLINLAMVDDAAREQAMFAVYLSTQSVLGKLPEFSAMLDKLDKSKKLDERAFAAVARDMAPPTTPPMLVPADRLVEGVRSRYAWLRTIAINRLSQNQRTNPTWHVDCHAALFDAILDPNPDVARDAALRLAGVVPMEVGNIFQVQGASATIFTGPSYPVPAKLPPQLTGLDDPTPSHRIRVLNAAPTQPQFASSLISSIVPLFADPDANVANTARKSTRAIVRASLDATAPHQVVSATPLSKLNLALYRRSMLQFLEDGGWVWPAGILSTLLLTLAIIHRVKRNRALKQ